MSLNEPAGVKDDMYNLGALHVLAQLFVTSET